MHKYSFRVFWSDGDNAFVAVCPELPGVSAIGATEDEALREAKIAQELYIEDMLESGEPLPAPQTAQEYSGQTRLRMPKPLHRLAAEMAREEDSSLNQYVVDAVRAKVAGEQVGLRYLEEVKRLLHETEQRLTRQTVQHGWKLAASLAGMLDESVTAQPSKRLARQPYRKLQFTFESLSTGEGEASLSDLISQINRQL